MSLDYEDMMGAQRIVGSGGAGGGLIYKADSRYAVGTATSGSFITREMLQTPALSMPLQQAYTVWQAAFGHRWVEPTDIAALGDPRMFDLLANRLVTALLAEKLHVQSVGHCVRLREQD
jgi:hypothetical protein